MDGLGGLLEQTILQQPLSLDQIMGILSFGIHGMLFLEIILKDMLVLFLIHVMELILEMELLQFGLIVMTFLV